MGSFGAVDTRPELASLGAFGRYLDGFGRSIPPHNDPGRTIANVTRAVALFGRTPTTQIGFVWRAERLGQALGSVGADDQSSS
jgi:hypothetical protein